jgi:hypothetical protein
VNKAIHHNGIVLLTRAQVLGMITIENLKSQHVIQKLKSRVGDSIPHRLGCDKKDECCSEDKEKVSACDIGRSFETILFATMETRPRLLSRSSPKRYSAP